MIHPLRAPATWAEGLPRCDLGHRRPKALCFSVLERPRQSQGEQSWTSCCFMDQAGDSRRKMPSSRRWLPCSRPGWKRFGDGWARTHEKWLLTGPNRAGRRIRLRREGFTLPVLSIEFALTPGHCAWGERVFRIRLGASHRGQNFQPRGGRGRAQKRGRDAWSRGATNPPARHFQAADR